MDRTEADAIDKVLRLQGWVGTELHHQGVPACHPR